VRASMAAGAGRGRVGLAGEPVEPLLCADKGKNRAGRFAHRVNRSQVNSQTNGRQRRWCSTTASQAALQRDRGAAPKGVEGANL
jgi:hypothetical protein